MKHVAKLIIIAEEDKYLLLQRSDHPRFGDNPDLPGGTSEYDEMPLDTLIREVQEEIGIAIDKEKVRLVCERSNYSTKGTRYYLYITKLNKRPELSISWEHSSYSWLDRDSFLQETKNTTDTYMNMVHKEFINLFSN